MTEPDRAGASTPGPDRPTRRGVWASLRRWRAPIVMIPLVLGLVYSGTVGAKMLWAEVNPEPAPEPVVTCWDDTEATAAECPAPAGLPGLRYVFLSFRPAADGCKKVTYPESDFPRPLEYRCTVRIDGGRASITYSERSDLDRGLTYFDKRYDVRAVRTNGGARLRYTDSEPRKNGTYEATVALTSYPFAVTVSAANERLRDAALDERVRIRADRFLTTRPPEDPGPTDTDTDAG